MSLAGIVAGLTLVTMAMAWSEAPATALARHAYAAPVLLAALRFGVPGAVLTAVTAVLLAASFVLPDVELTGVEPVVADALVAYPMLVLGGGLSGGLVAEARRHRERYDLVVQTQRVLSEAGELATALDRVRALLGVRLHARVALAVREGSAVLVSGASGLATASLGARVLATGVSAFVADVGGGARPRRVLVTPLLARGETIGVLVVERVGELGAGERATIEALGAHIGLGLENARLAAAQRRFNEELAHRVAEATARVEAIDRAKTAFVTTASHELRTPLTALQGFGELLAVRTFPPAEVRRLGGVIRTEAERLARIVTDLLDLSRLERGLPPALRRVPLRVEEALESAVEVFRGDGRHRLVLACEDGLPCVEADPDALARILRNLVSNAIKYSPRDTTIRLAARGLAEGVEMTVSDEGPGIAADALPHVFEPYFRAPRTARTVPGTGIGLAVVKSLVEAHGGRVSLTSEAGAGTRAIIVLPVHR